MISSVCVFSSRREAARTIAGDCVGAPLKDKRGGMRPITTDGSGYRSVRRKERDRAPEASRALTVQTGMALPGASSDFGLYLVLAVSSWYCISAIPPAKILSSAAISVTNCPGFCSIN